MELKNHSFPERLELRLVESHELTESAALEAASYPEDEAASAEALNWRHTHAGKHFYGIYKDSSRLIGYIVGTLSTSKELTHESMAAHDADGTSLCIHSVVVTGEYQRKGIALSALRAYVELVKMNNRVIGHSLSSNAAEQGDEGGVLEQILLIAKGDLLSLYIKAGFELVGLSKVVHGKDPWFEMRMDLSPSYYVVDAFTDTALRGNPAGVVFHISNELQQQAIANEFNYNTAFVTYRKEDGDFNIRWYTPVQEVDLCGHATVATMRALIHSKRVNSSDVVNFHTRKCGIIKAKVSAETGNIGIEFGNDVIETRDGDPNLVVQLCAALGVDDSEVMSSIVAVVQGSNGLLVEVTTNCFYQLKPNTSLMKALPNSAQHLIITSKWGGNNEALLSQPPSNVAPHTMTRVYYKDPVFGMVEDFVCGSAHRTLSAYWFPKLGLKVGEEALVSWQASSRGGLVYATRGESTTKVEGQAAICCEGKLTIHAKA